MDEQKTDYLALLVGVVTPPTRPVYNDGPVSWDEIERAMGFALPDDYKQLIHTYGYGRSAAIWVFTTLSNVALPKRLLQTFL